MKLDEFEIRFDSHRGVFAAGESVTGYVGLKLTKPMKMRCIRLQFDGKAKTHWEMRQGRSKQEYRASEAYLSQVITLFGTGNTPVEHPTGVHKYPFSVQLNHSLPSSFEGRKGYVRYFCKATIYRPWKFDEHIKRAFTVIHHLDLNYEPAAAIPVVGEKEVTIEGCCCSQGMVHASLFLNKTGYVPGEPIDYTIEVNNMSDKDVIGLEFDLRQIVRYTGYSESLFSSRTPKFHSKTDNFALFTGTCLVKSHSTQTINKSIRIPALPPSRLKGCGIIDITYVVVFQPMMRWSTLRIEKEIILGSIPLHCPLEAPPSFAEAVMQGGPHAMGHAMTPTAPPEDMLMPPPYQEPPPSYEESCTGRVEIRDENDDNNTGGLVAWAPSYPVYNWDANARHFQMTAGAFAGMGDAPVTSQPMPQAMPVSAPVDPPSIDIQLRPLPSVPHESMGLTQSAEALPPVIPHTVSMVPPAHSAPPPPIIMPLQALPPTPQPMGLQTQSGEDFPSSSSQPNSPPTPQLPQPPLPLAPHSMGLQTQSGEAFPFSSSQPGLPSSSAVMPPPSLQPLPQGPMGLQTQSGDAFPPSQGLASAMMQQQTSQPIVTTQQPMPMASQPMGGLQMQSGEAFPTLKN